MVPIRLCLALNAALSDIAGMITPRHGHGLAVLDRQLWVVGGFINGSLGCSVFCERLDDATNAWVAAPNLPVPTTDIRLRDQITDKLKDFSQQNHFFRMTGG